MPPKGWRFQMACLSARGIVWRARSNLADIPGTIHIGRRGGAALWTRHGSAAATSAFAPDCYPRTTSVPLTPASALAMLGGLVISACFPPASRNSTSAVIFGPMLPLSNCPAA